MTIVWSTEAVDTSAILLSQALDAVFTKQAHESATASDDVTVALKNESTQVILYGPVALPGWLPFDNSRMFNKPISGKKMDVLNYLRENKMNALKYILIKDDTTYTSLREKLGAKFDVAVKNSLQVVATVSNAKEFNDLKGKVAWACQHLTSVKKVRFFFGDKDVISRGVIGMSFTEKKLLSFREALMYNASEDAKTHVSNLFEHGLLKETMGEGFLAWTEEKTVGGDALDGNDAVVNSLIAVGELLKKQYSLDFMAIDASVQEDGTVVVTNVTTAPSLQSDEVLSLVSAYFTNLLSFGRTITKEQLIQAAESFSAEQLALLAKLMKKENLIKGSV